MNRIIFGGSFDPIHLGHINMAKKASEQFDAEVYFVPAPVSVWKKESISVDKKIDMIKLSIEDEKRFHIDLFEVKSGNDINYSLYTAEYFVNKYPNDEIFYLIGVDQVNKFHLWYEAEKLAKIVHIIFFDRPDCDTVDQNNINKFNMQMVNGELIEASSSEIRNLKCMQLKNKVIDYIVENNLYFIPKIRSMIDERRFEHAIQVAKLAKLIAEYNDPKIMDQAFIAGLMHDIGKTKEAESIVKIHFPEYKDMPRFSYHQFAGAWIANNIFGINDSKVLNAIKYHATGNENMSQLDKIVYAADKIEPTRGYDSSNLIKAMLDNIDKGFVTVLKANKDYLLEEGKCIDNPLTDRCFKQYLNQ